MYRAFLTSKCVGTNVIITAGSSEFLLGYHTANTEEAVKGRDERSAPLTASFVLVSFSEATTPSFAGESKKALASSIERSEKKTKNLAMVRS